MMFWRTIRKRGDPLSITINKWTIVEYSEIWTAIVLFVNSLSLVVVKLNSFSREEINALAEYCLLKNYMLKSYALIEYNEVCKSEKEIDKPLVVLQNESWPDNHNSPMNYKKNNTDFAELLLQCVTLMEPILSMLE